ncbi:MULTISPECIES: CrpP-related protein [Achromobacter]|nr:CrpP-related protein [Achromobacter sp. RTa]
MPRDDIQELGAQAAWDGLTLFDCPYFRARALPSYTGESISTWKQKVDAWEQGWQAETDNRRAKAERAAALCAMRRLH